MEWVEILAVVFSLFYVILAARNIIWCWPVAIISVVFFGWLTFEKKLYAEAALQVYYLVMAVYGWLNWRYRESEKSNPIIHWPMKYHLIIILIGTVGFLLTGFFLSRVSDAQVPYFDAFTTVFSVLATFLTARKVLENWLYWIVIDFASIFLYLGRDLYLTTGLFAGYTIAAIWGFYHWRNLRSRQDENRLIPGS